MKTAELVNHINLLLKITDFSDYAPNGLQISGKDEINHIVLGVSTSQALIEHAIKVNADAILVHHGLFWKNDDACLIGIKKQRVKDLLVNDINLLSYHLPLDAHIKIGNNAQLAKLLAINNPTPVNSSSLLWLGEINVFDFEEFIENIAAKLERKPLVINKKILSDYNNRLLSDKQLPKTIKVAWCSGAAQDELLYAKQLGAMIYISGEVSERNYYEAIEGGICYISAGHYATEKFGIQALGSYLSEKYQLTSEFFLEDNPI